MGQPLPNDVTNQLAGELAHLVVSQLAPEELVVFDETATEYFEDPDAVLSPHRREESLGFGLEIAMLTPYVIAAAAAAVHWLAGSVADSVKDESQSLVASWIHRLFRPGAERRPGHEPSQVGSSDAAALSLEQVRRVRQVAFERSRTLGLPERDAGLIADSVAGALATSG